MKTILLAILLFFSTSLLAGDWDLFQSDHKIYYYDEEAEVIDWFQFESTQSNCIKSFKYDVIQGTVGCPFDTSYTNYFIEKSPWHIDSLVVLNHVNRYSYNSIGSVEYQKTAEVGSSWTVIATDPTNQYDTITITCIAKEFETFFGLTDSVKTFAFTPNGYSNGQIPASDFQMRVSKNYGVLEMIPFQLLLLHPPKVDFHSLKTIGIETPAFTVGYTPLKINDYFNYQVGQILNWEYCYGSGVLIELYRDSITSVTYSPNGVAYTYDRFVYNIGFGTLNFLQNQTWSIDFSSMPAFNAPIGSGAFQKYNLDTTCRKLYTNDQFYEVDQYSNDTIHQTTLSATPILLDINTCVHYYVLVYKDILTYDSRYGLIDHCFREFFGTYNLKRVLPGPCPGDSSLTCFDLPPNIDCDNGGMSNGQECMMGLDPFDPSDDIKIVLPIEITTFTGELKHNTIELKWNTATEINSSHFEIERSNNSSDFRKISTVKAAGNTHQPIDYQFLDEFPPTGILYYRLKMVDQDNSYTYSNVISVKIAGSEHPIKLLPNPVKVGADVEIILHSEIKQKGQIRLFDLTGKERLLQVLPPGSRHHQITTNELEAGVYLLQMELDGEQNSKKLVVY